MFSFVSGLTLRGAIKTRMRGALSGSRLVVQLGIDSRRVAVEHNRIVVKKSAYTSTLISDGDEVEVVNFVGGG